jgi:hypothetical protein
MRQGLSVSASGSLSVYRENIQRCALCNRKQDCVAWLKVRAVL